MTSTNKLCCDQPPRLLSKEGFGYALICMECGNGMNNEFWGRTYQSAEHLWSLYSDLRAGQTSFVTKILLEELNEAHDTLRNVAFVLGAGGYNATHVDAKKFGEKIHWGIDALSAPLLKMIKDRDAEIKKLKEEPGPVEFVLIGQTLYGLREDGMVIQKRFDNTWCPPLVTLAAAGLTVQNAFEEALHKKSKEKKDA